MTEDEWECCTNLLAMLVHLRGEHGLSDEELRLHPYLTTPSCTLVMGDAIPGTQERLPAFAREVCRYWCLLPLNAATRQVVVAYERFLNGEDSYRRFRRHVRAMRAARDNGDTPLIGAMSDWWLNPLGVANLAYELAAMTAQHTRGELMKETIERNRLAPSPHQMVLPSFGEIIYPMLRPLPSLLREIVGNPFRRPHLPTALPPWVTSIAIAAYDARDPSSGHLDAARLGVLADALEEVGADAELVAHLREAGPHPAGCYVVDLVRGQR
jgi:hypothetical protein